MLLSHDLCISFTTIKYNKGPRIDPCGTPHEITWREDQNDISNKGHSGITDVTDHFGFF